MFNLPILVVRMQLIFHQNNSREVILNSHNQQICCAKLKIKLKFQNQILFLHVKSQFNTHWGPVAGVWPSGQQPYVKESQGHPSLFGPLAACSLSGQQPNWVASQGQSS